MSVRERHPAPAVSAREPVTAAYVDNANLIAFPPNAARRHHAKMAASFLEVGLTMHEFATDATDHETLGIVVHGHERRVRHEPQRVWRFYLASLELLRRGHARGEELQVWLGHAVHLLMLLLGP